MKGHTGEHLTIIGKDQFRNRTGFFCFFEQKVEMLNKSASSRPLSGDFAKVPYDLI